ncbi:MAG: TIGR00159 family protein [Cytophagales bacterium]|nr:TIGR00159 family protein [Cytophagales bacterium]
MILGFNVGFLEIDWVDLIDILLVTILIAQVYKLMRGSMAIRVFFGFLSLYLIYLFVKAAEMELLSNILGQFMGVGVLAVIVLFQQEIRKFLLLIGRTTAFQEGQFMKNVRSILKTDNAYKADVAPIVDAMKTLAASKTGALIVISKDSELKFYVESGDQMDAIISKRLLMAIFNKESPMHDGAVIIYHGKILAARCILPVTEKDDLPAHFGLRHRAAIGMTENTDTLVIAVSEETGQISTVQNGRISSNLAPLELRTAINEYLADEKTAKEGFGKIFRRRAAV